MPANSTRQFNSAAVGVTQIGQQTTVSVSVDVSQTKIITGILASACVSVGVGTVVPSVQGRLILCTGSLQFDPETGNVAGGPLAPRTATLPTGANRVLLDLEFFDLLDLNFSDPFTVPSDETVNALIGTTVIYQNGAVSLLDPALVKLTLKGYTGQKNQEFPFKLR